MLLTRKAASGLFCTLFTLIFGIQILLPAPAIAASPSFPPSMTGNWSFGSCDDPSHLKIQNSFGSFDIFLRDDAASTFRIAFFTNWKESQERLIVEFFNPSSSAENTIELYIHNDRLNGRMLRCPSVPSKILWAYNEPISAFIAAGEIRDECVMYSSNSVQCFDKIVQYIDLTNDGEITPAELARLMRAITFFILYASIQEDEPRRVHELAGIAAAVGLSAPLILATVMPSLDYDADKKLSKEEIILMRGDITVLAIVSLLVEPEAALRGVRQLGDAMLEYVFSSR